jgi:hypothetical protein
MGKLSVVPLENRNLVGDPVLRDKATIFRPDIRFGFFVKIAPDGRESAMTIGDLYDTVAPFDLPATVPEEVRAQFDLARYAFIYSWFAYEMVTLAEQQSFTAAEMALSRKAKDNGLNLGRLGLRRAVNKALELGWLRKTDFDFGTGSGPRMSSLDFMIDIRNKLMHGDPHLMPDGSRIMMGIVHQVISALFP